MTRFSVSAAVAGVTLRYRNPGGGADQIGEAGADINEESRAALVLDSDTNSGWGISAETGKAHFLIVQAARPLALASAGARRVRLVP